MKKVVRLTESDLVRLVKKVINEQRGIYNEKEKEIVKNLNQNLKGKTVQLYSDKEQQNKKTLLKVGDIFWDGEGNDFNKTNTHALVIYFENLIEGEPRMGSLKFDCNVGQLIDDREPAWMSLRDNTTGGGPKTLYNKTFTDYLTNNYCKLLPPDKPQPYDKPADFASIQKPTNPPQSFA
jgi:hypothetical protein